MDGHKHGLVGIFVASTASYTPLPHPYPHLYPHLYRTPPYPHLITFPTMSRLLVVSRGALLVGIHMNMDWLEAPLPILPLLIPPLPKPHLYSHIVPCLTL